MAKTLNSHYRLLTNWSYIHFLAFELLFTNKPPKGQRRDVLESQVKKTNLLFYKK